MSDSAKLEAAVPERLSADPTVAIAFGGGGARGLAHVHIIEALDELGIRPVAITGSSIGSIMGAGMASGMSGADIRAYILSTVGKRAEVVSRIWSMRPSSVRDALAGGIRLGQYNLERILKVFLPEAIPETFADLKIPLQVTTTDYFGHEGLILSEGDLYQALAASAAIPAVFMPVRMNDRLMIDGGVFNPVPYENLFGKADIIIGVDVVGAPEGDCSIIPNRIDSLFGASQLMMQSLIAQKLKSNPPDIFLRPDVNRFRVLDFLKAQDVLSASEGIKDELKRALDAEFAFRANSAVVSSHN